MTSYFKKPIIIFGLAVPLLITVLIIAVISFFSMRIDKKLKKNRALYKAAETEQKQVATLQAEVGQNVAYLEQWEANLGRETRGSFLEHWKNVEKKFSSKEFRRSPHNWINQSNGLGRSVNHPGSQVEMNFSATFRAMQMALIEIESTLPQMQLDSFSMSPDSEGERLNFKTRFTVWTQN